ncbi:MAG: hypothetical protein GXY55_14235 [Phycisphaerae bacterium]|jgi:hypothetical protein|nr:hypothetical protein [Phycisphaerae bacterium]
MSEEILTIVLSILSAVVAGAIGIVTIYVKRKWSAEIESGQFATVMAQVLQVVRGAEMMGAAFGWNSEAKKEWALKEAARLTGIPAENLKTLIEAAVAQIKAAGEELMRQGQDVVPKVV